MRSRKVGLALLAGVGIALGIGCTEDATGPDPTQRGALEVWLNLTGNTPDPDGCTVAVLGHLPQQIAAGETVTFPDLAVGTHVVTLADVETFCTVNTENPRSVTVTSDQTVTVQFDVTCGNAAPESDVAGMEVLGSGYGVMGNYADVTDVRAQVLDLAALEGQDLLRQVQYERATYHVVSGETSHEYQRSLSARVKITGSAFGFSGALRASFKQDRYESRHYSFATVQSLIRKHGLRVALYVTPEELRAFLTQPAAAAINDPSIDPVYLFETFGTHVLRGIIVGGRLDFSTSANMSFEKQDRSIDVYARASFKNVFASASIEAQATDDLSWSEYSATEEKHLEVYGGRSEYGQYIMTEGVYESWIESINDNSVFMDFESSGLLGIWELADDASRRSELEAAWNTYAEAYGITLEQAGSIVSNFEEDTEGWTVHDASLSPTTPEHRLQAGYFGAYIVGAENASQHGLSFYAPAKFSGDKTMYAGGKLEYYMWYATDPHDIFNPPGWFGSLWYYVVLISENGNLVYRPANSDAAPDPDSPFRPGNYRGSDPTLFAVNLTAGEQNGDDGTVPGMWYRWDDEPATEADIWMSLASARAFKIRGDFLTILDESVAIDKVSLRAPPGSP